jgi:hypothetical protein
VVDPLRLGTDAPVCSLTSMSQGRPVHRRDGAHFGTSVLSIDSTSPARFGALASARLPAGAGHQDPTEQVQVKDKGNNEYQAPPSSRIAEHGDDYGDPDCQHPPDHQR